MDLLSDNILVQLSYEKDVKYNCLMSQEARVKMEEFIASDDCQNQEKRKSIFKKWLKFDNLEPPLELLWKLNEEELLFVTTYFYLHDSYSVQLHTSFKQIYTENHDSEERQTGVTIISNILVTLINTYLIKEDIFNNYFQGLVKNIIDHGIKLIDEDKMIGCFITDMLNSVYMFSSCWEQFSLDCLKRVLDFVSEDEINLNYVVENHIKQWTINNIKNNTKNFLLEILRLLPIESVVVELKLAADKDNLNWKYFLMIISIVVQENSALIKREVDNWLNISFEQINRHYFTVALIVARHCCYEKAKNFNNYVNWFGSLQLKTVPVFNLVIQFLTDIVPHEPPLYLKIHVSKVLSSPGNCQNVLQDYLNLAKTRLLDLNESTEYLGLFNDLHESDKIGQDMDVMKAISMFKETGEVPKAVLEAQIFRKNYYEKVFLNHLLKIGSNEDPDRAILIKKLHSSGKISNQAYRTWKNL